MRYFKKMCLGGMLLASVVCNAHADEAINTGTYSLSGSASYSSNETDHRTNSNLLASSTIKTRSLNLYPKFMYFVSPGISLGMSMSYQRIKTDGNSYSTRGIGPVARFYPGSSPVHPFFEASYVVSNPSDNPASYISNSGNIHTASVGTGLDVFIARNVAVEPMLSYSSSRYDQVVTTFVGNGTYNVTDNNLTVSVGINVFVY